ncbi:MAG: glycosyltransferase [Patescibacteria group bacterium]
MVDFKKNFNEKQVAFLDVNILSHEGFTSGALIYMKEILNMTSQLGLPSGILSLVSNKECQNKIEKYSYVKNGLRINEVFINTKIKNQKRFKKALDVLFDGFLGGGVFMNSPAVNLEKEYLYALEYALGRTDNVVIVVPDVLYPTYKTHARNLVDRLYLSFKKATIVAPSNFVRKRFFKDTGILAEIIPNLFDKEKVISNKGSHKYITLVNSHPMKGIDIFNSVASKLPNKKFLIIESWLDVPRHSKLSSNILFHRFFRNTKKIYENTKILLAPSLCEEGCPRVITEALLNGIPVVAIDIGGIAEAGFKTINLIESPKIQGDVISPKINLNDLDIISNNFVLKINDIEKKCKNGFKKSDKLQKLALKEIKKSESVTRNFLIKLFKISEKNNKLCSIK